MRTAQFDDLARIVASPATRRIALRLLAGSLLTAVLPNARTAHAQFEGTAASCAAVGLDFCTSGHTAAYNADTGEFTPYGSCVDLSSDPANCGACDILCGAGQVCASGSCLYADIIERPPGDPRLMNCADAGLTDCFGVCVDVWTDPANCGSCGGVCGAGDACFGGVCFTPAPGGLDLGG